MSLYLVSCVKTKGLSAAPAKELYTSDWFRKARAYVERTGQPWFILSAKYGLLHPEEVIEPYELTLNSMPVVAQRVWAEEVFAALEPHLVADPSVVFLAGRCYREFLERRLHAQGIDVAVPMAGMRQGVQLSWLKRRLSDLPLGA